QRPVPRVLCLVRKGSDRPRNHRLPLITRLQEIAMSKQLAPVHPGEILREEFLKPYGLTAGKVAKACGLPRTRIERIVNEETGITGDTALRLGQLFRTSAEFWINLQGFYDVQVARREIGEAIDEIEPVAALEAA
ncbi:MAG TPA: HigA family addiction module antitoxin, partial [Methylovirgula sp.]